MYIERLDLYNVRTFTGAILEFVHPDREFRPRGRPAGENSKLLPMPRLPNVNLLLGDNGSGKSSVLRSLAMTALGPSFADAMLPTQGMVRRALSAEGKRNKADRNQSYVFAELILHEQDRQPGERLRSGFVLSRRGELENVSYLGSKRSLQRNDDLGESKRLDGSAGLVPKEGWKDALDLVPAKTLWDPVFESRNDAFFAVGYGATRRVEAPETLDTAARGKSTFIRGQRLQSLFQESFSLIPLSTWLPFLKNDNPGRYTQVEHLLNRLLKPGRYTFTGARDPSGDYLFEQGGLRVPFQGLSDGYRAFIGWVADMLFHLCYGCPSGKKLVDNSGFVMVDEIDLHLHPRWQMKVIPTVARALPRMQFIFTSHSPLVASSLEWMNIITLKHASRSNQTHVRRLEQSIHGLDADQVLISDFFGLSSTRAKAKSSKLDELTLKARRGDDAAARRLIAELANGMEDEVAEPAVGTEDEG